MESSLSDSKAAFESSVVTSSIAWSSDDCCRWRRKPSRKGVRRSDDHVCSSLASSFLLFLSSFACASCCVKLRRRDSVSFRSSSSVGSADTDGDRTSTLLTCDPLFDRSFLLLLPNVDVEPRRRNPLFPGDLTFSAEPPRPNDGFRSSSLPSRCLLSATIAPAAPSTACSTSSTACFTSSTACSTSRMSALAPVTEPILRMPRTKPVDACANGAIDCSSSLKMLIIAWPVSSALASASCCLSFLAISAASSAIRFSFSSSRFLCVLSDSYRLLLTARLMAFANVCSQMSSARLPYWLIRSLVSLSTISGRWKAAWNMVCAREPAVTLVRSIRSVWSA